MKTFGELTIGDMFGYKYSTMTDGEERVSYKIYKVVSKEDGCLNSVVVYPEYALTDEEKEHVSMCGVDCVYTQFQFSSEDKDKTEFEFSLEMPNDGRMTYVYYTDIDFLKRQITEY